MESRPKIPASIKREIRQRCGFGCVICGCPVFDYEHIEGIGATGHDPTQMTLLCPTHHREKTVGRMPVSVVKNHDAHPFNTGATFGAGHPLYFAPGDITLGLGNMGIRPSPGSGNVVGIVSFGDFALGVGITSDGHPVLNIDIRDEHDAPLLVVKEGELRVSPANWDVDFVGPRLTLRSALRATVLDVVLDAPGGRVEVISANFYLHGIRMLAGKQAREGGFELPHSGNWWAHLTLEGLGIAVGPPKPPGPWFHISGRPAFLGA